MRALATTWRTEGSHRSPKPRKERRSRISIVARRSRASRLRGAYPGGLLRCVPGPGHKVLPSPPDQATRLALSIPMTQTDIRLDFSGNDLASQRTQAVAVFIRTARRLLPRPRPPHGGTATGRVGLAGAGPAKGTVSCGSLSGVDRAPCTGLPVVRRPGRPFCALRWPRCLASFSSRTTTPPGR